MSRSFSGEVFFLKIEEVEGDAEETKDIRLATCQPLINNSTFASIANALLAWSKKGVKRS
jgi:hypothetical protein